MQLRVWGWWCYKCSSPSRSRAEPGGNLGENHPEQTILCFRLKKHLKRQARIFLKTLAPTVLSTYGPSISWKIWGKSNEPILRKKCFHNRETDKYRIILYLFGLFLHKQEFLQKILLHQFWVLMIPQLHAKYQIKN